MLISTPHLDPREIGYLTTGKAGFPLHLSLVLDAESWRRPLGIIHAEALFRPKQSAKKAKAKASATAKKGKREFDRWWRGMEASSKALGKCEQVIHVAACDGDSYELMARVLSARQRLVIRVRVGDRRGRKAGTGRRNHGLR